MSESVDVAIIGAGQAGLATSWYLKQAGVDHVVLEAGRVAETWRSRRWDSFCLVTPNWSVQLPGAPYDGPDPDGYMDVAALVDHFQRWSDSFDAPVREGCSVAALDAEGDGFALTLPDGKLRARTVVVASGGYQRAHLPDKADEMPKTVTQLLAEDYTNPSALAPGAVLIVGSGQTGCQLAEELQEAERKVLVACGRCGWAPRRWGGRDLARWTVDSGWWNRTAATPATRLLGNVLSTGHNGGHDLNHRTLYALGVELLGHYIGAEDNKVHFADDLTQLVEASDNLALMFRNKVAAYCEHLGIAMEWEMPPPMGVSGRTKLDLHEEGITTVIWTAGYRPDYSWVHFPVFDDMGFPVQVDGRSSVPGLYFMGVHFQRKAQSAVLYGVGEDAEIVARDITKTTRPILASGGTSP